MLSKDPSSYHMFTTPQSVSRIAATLSRKSKEEHWNTGMMVILPIFYTLSIPLTHALSPTEDWGGEPRTNRRTTEMKMEKASILPSSVRRAQFVRSAFGRAWRCRRRWACVRSKTAQTLVRRWGFFDSSSSSLTFTCRFCFPISIWMFTNDLPVRLLIVLIDTSFGPCLYDICEDSDSWTTVIDILIFPCVQEKGNFQTCTLHRRWT